VIAKLPWPQGDLYNIRDLTAEGTQVNLKFPHKNTHFRRIFRGFRVDRVWWFCLHADGLE
jgi:hypothetical protein